MIAGLSFAAAALGLGLLSLAMPRHAQRLTGRAAALATAPAGRAALRCAGAGCLTLSGVVAIVAHPQLGWIVWGAELMLATLLIAGLQVRGRSAGRRPPDLPRGRTAD
jgi:hypothetical protein